MEHIFNIINNLAFTLLAVSPTVFIFGVTLLGTALEKAKQEEKTARDNEADSIRKEIAKLEEALNKAKRDGNISEMYNQLEQLKSNQFKTEKKIKKIKDKYGRLDFTNTVLYPCLAFLFVVLLSPIAERISDFYFSSTIPVLVLQCILLIYGLVKICFSLRLVQEISSTKRESENYDHLRETIKLALFEHEQRKKEEVELYFISPTFPVNVPIFKELSIEFRVRLVKGTILYHTVVWFFIPDGFELIIPPESKSWRQSSEYALPNIRTVKVEIGDVNTGINSMIGILKIKTPNNIGKYSIRYRIFGTGYAGSAQDVGVFVV